MLSVHSKSSHILWVEGLLIEASSFGWYEMACVFKATIIPLFIRPGNLKGVAGFKKRTKLYPDKCRIKSLSL